MDYFVVCIVGVVVIFTIYYLSTKYYFFTNSEYLKSNNQDKNYLIKDTKNKYAKVQLIDSLMDSIDKLLNHIEDKGVKFDNLEINKTDIQEVKDKLKKSEILENLTDTDTSYTINKGDKIVLCLANRETDELYDYNLLIYVLIHELAHVLSPTYGHDDNFKKIFRILIDNAEEIGIYKYEDYKQYPKEYCGMTLNTNIK